MTNIVAQDTTNTTFQLFTNLAKFDHEQVLVCNDNRTGLRAIIAIHNTILGPGLGGTRMWQYRNESEAFTDALRLSRGMTYKAAISGLNLGGAKAVIIGDAKTMKNEALMRRFGKFVNNLAGKYITAEDVGTTTQDMEYVNMETDHVVGLPETRGGGGDPSPITAYGVYMGIKASAKKAYGNDSLSGKKIAVQGIGKVGMHLVELLHKEGAQTFVSDIHEESLQQASQDYNSTILGTHEIHSADVDIFAPCALGAVLNETTIPDLKCDIIAGSANNQLKEEDSDGMALKEKGILYAPDFLINAGGLINVYSEYTGYKRQIAMAETEKIYDTTLDIYRVSESQGVHTQKAAILLAEKRIEDMLHVTSRI